MKRLLLLLLVIVGVSVGCSDASVDGDPSKYPGDDHVDPPFTTPAP